MAKIAFSKLSLSKNTSVRHINFNEQTIEVKQYLPINEKLELISRVINLSADENNFSNPIKLEIFGTLEIIFAYTNISFTEKQKEDPCKLYDLLEGNGLIDLITSVIPSIEHKTIIEGIESCSSAIYTYKNSILGLLESISQDYSELNLDAAAIQGKLADPQNMDLLREVLTKLG